ncbi:MAG: hypothetical protein LBE36_09385, partial [Flavobacteriaceae bacterium]|nr:hypothetical protein [Flavobacteriaceae bacterium]
MKKIIISLLSIVILTSCKNNKIDNMNSISKNAVTNDTIELIKKYINLQEMHELPEDDTDISHLYHLTDTDYELGGYAVSKMLKNSGYKEISRDVFMDKIKLFFERSSDCSLTQKKQHDTFYTLFINNTKEKDIEKTEDDYTYDHIFVFPKYGVITYLPLLGDMVEIKDNKIHFNNPNPILVHRNKYLFNDDKASLVWLLFNDKDFLEQLVRVFGYDKEEKINKMVLEKAAKQYDESNRHNNEILDHLFAAKDCYGKLQIRESLMKYILENTTVKNNKMAVMLGDYALHVRYPEPEELKEFTEAEKLKIMAYVGYYDQLIRDKNNIDDPESPDVAPEGWDNGGFLRNELVSNQALLEEIKKNNYYNLSGFKDMIEGILYQIEIDSEKWMREHPEQDGNVKNITPQLPQTVHLYIR